MVVKRSAADQTLLAHLRSPSPIDTISQTTMPIEPRPQLPPFHDFLLFRPIGVEVDDLEAVVHAGDEDIIRPRRGRMPFDSPGAASERDRVDQGSKGIPWVEEGERLVVSCGVKD